ncbi:ATP-binding cassette domain-containing protein [Catenulispora sp. NF23]|uniref:ATP-binding cassette domain-containing protein n=1 Tax=Catenulispora pinistramenti TaxID=2705254 RepID=A0ABS5KP94_9ACTN|nr:ATP-binding cassette domain-containing protein [Catenulispora pinistramenti]MBS2547872.1 ATP-binding cassette domain-containing protein [Catenulispora pinistramenti]
MIEARGLARTFRGQGGTVEAVRGVDLDVQAGEIVGFLGTNGAGKTTTLRMLTTLLAPTGGSATVAGADLIREPGAVRRRIGYVAQSTGAHPDFTVFEELLTQGRLYRMRPAEARRRAVEASRRLDLQELHGRQVRSLSGGQRRRLDVALGLVHGPPLIFLDEPSTGLDPQSRRTLWDLVARLRAESGTTIFLTTHYLQEADALCDRILVMDRGRIVAAGTPEELKQRLSGDVITVALVREDPAAHAAIRALPGVSHVTRDDRTLRLTAGNGAQVLFAVIRALGDAGVAVQGVQIERPTLDDVFHALTGQPREGGADHDRTVDRSQAQGVRDGVRL